MKPKYLNRIAAIWCCANSLVVGSEAVADPARPLDVNQIKIQKNVIVDLRIPYDTILQGEIPHVYLGIKNSGDQPLSLITDFAFRSGDQLLFEAVSGKDQLNLTKPLFIPTWDRINQEVHDENYELVRLEAGGFKIYGRNGGGEIPRLGWNYDVFPDGATKIRVGLLTGEEEWAFSEWVSYQRLDERKLNNEEVLKVVNEGTTREKSVRQASIDGVSYLFLTNPSNGTRIARIPEGSIPRIEVDGEQLQQKLIIHFDGVTVPPVIHWISQIETLQGSLETAPHLDVMKSLEEGMSQGVVERDSRPPLSGGKSKNRNDGSLSEGGSVDDNGKNDPLFVLLGAIVVLGASIVVYLRRK